MLKLAMYSVHGHLILISDSVVVLPIIYRYILFVILGLLSFCRY